MRKQKIGVMICTAQRPRMVSECVRSILAQNVSEDQSVEICVVENDSQQLSRETIENLNAEGGFPVLYYQEPVRGIPKARNKTLEVAVERGYDWIALIDDDEVADPHWLSELLRVAQVHSADVVSGPVRRRYEAPPPKWWKHLNPAAETEGAELSEAPTNNTLLSRKLFAKDGLNLRFHDALTFGFEDIDYFQRAHDLGCRIVWAPMAGVEEEIPASRMEPERLIQRVMTSAAAHSYATKLRRGTGSAVMKFGGKAIRRIIGGALICLFTGGARIAGARSFESAYYKGRVRLARGLGNLRGLFQMLPSYYDTVDGN